MRIDIITNKMKSDNNYQQNTEKPQHVHYLNDFRTHQCALFLQHKCTQHRPYTCFNWHFMNQRRRRPILKYDGDFNYNPDVYCTKYDETTGICSDGDSCELLHRTAGDTERRYHLRYYKTNTCVHQTDSKGHCVKNGQHCAFAHGPSDMRNPIQDRREKMTNGVREGLTSLEKDKIMNEDPRWNEMPFVLANYKTELCKRPPRLCRQGFACPSFHNSRDKRRGPLAYKYRSTPCPNVKHGDDWGDPTQCENNDQCQYCHTRTEQQFHPEIYKSTKCNDMIQTGYCPRGPFCAFAHVEQELNFQKEMAISTSSLAAYVAVGIQQEDTKQHPIGEERSRSYSMESKRAPSIPASSCHVGSAPTTMSFAEAAKSRKVSESFRNDGNTIHSVIGKALDEDVDDLSLTPFDFNEQDLDIDSLSSSFGNNLQSLQKSEPVRIPGRTSPNGYFITPPSSYGNEIDKLKEEIVCCRAKLKGWEDGYSQARAACEAWKKEVEDSNKKVKQLEDELQEMKIEREDARTMADQLQAQLKAVQSNIIVPLWQKEDLPNSIRDNIQSFLVDQSFQTYFRK